MDHYHDLGPSFKGGALENGEVAWTDAVEVGDAVIELGAEGVSVERDRRVDGVVLHFTILVGQVRLVERATGDLAGMGPADALVVFDHFPVAVLGVLRLTAPVVGNTLPHLETKDGEGQDKECVQHQDVAQLANRVQQGIDKNLHGWNRRQTP